MYKKKQEQEWLSYLHAHASKIFGNRLIAVIPLFQVRKKIGQLGTVVEERLFSAIPFICLIFELCLMCFYFKTNKCNLR